MASVSDERGNPVGFGDYPLTAGLSGLGKVDAFGGRGAQLTLNLGMYPSGNAFRITAEKGARHGVEHSGRGEARTR